MRKLDSFRELQASRENTRGNSLGGMTLINSTLNHWISQNSLI
jgi:hypothetical protein